MSTTAIQHIKPLTHEALKLRMHSHTNVRNSAKANLFKTGILDIELLQEAGMSVPESILECHVVQIEYAGETRNFATRKVDMLFKVFDSRGEFQGHYFCNAFKAFMK
jgi:hypothetical protein